MRKKEKEKRRCGGSAEGKLAFLMESERWQPTSGVSAKKRATACGPSKTRGQGRALLIGEAESLCEQLEGEEETGGRGEGERRIGSQDS